MASRIASEVIAEKSIEMGATSTLQTTPSTNPLMGQELQSYIRKSARIMVTTISSEIHRRLSRIANRLPFEEAYTAVSEAMTKAESVLAGSERFAAKLSRKADAAEKNAARAATTESPKKATSENAKRLADIAKGAREKATEADDLAKAWKMALQVDDRGNYNIRSKVIAKVTSWAVDRLATKPVIRSMGFISYSTDEHPARTLTMEQLKRYTAAKEPTDFLKRMEIENRQAAEGSAFAEFLKRNEMDGLE
ncbi:hypothetical protein F5Y04DRAFT_250761 [Hypomontagnella monticulosa]|nr:hypothetical protein F5Y04DRAFT_250761 [Hypomontagnella monticulosa]